MGLLFHWVTFFFLRKNIYLWRICFCIESNHFFTLASSKGLTASFYFPKVKYTAHMYQRRERIQPDVERKREEWSMSALSAGTGLRNHGTHSDFIVHSKPWFFHGVSLPNSKVMQSPPSCPLSTGDTFQDPQWMPETLASTEPDIHCVFFLYKHTYGEVSFIHQAESEMNNNN